MKKYILLFSFLATISLFAQETTPQDGLRYALDNLTGTARFRAMGGAFGALGGDLSSINVNAAGSVIFTNNQAGISLSSINVRNKSTYFGTNARENDSDLVINQAGVVFVFNNRNQKSDWKKFSLALNFENVNNLDNQIFTRGTNPTNSIDQYFLDYANAFGGIRLSVLESAFFENLNFLDQQALIGYQGFVINPVTTNPNNTEYVSNVPQNSNFFQENFTIQRGYNGKLTGNFATSYKDKVFFGFNLNSHFVDFTNISSIREEYSAATGLQSVQFDNETYTYGSGISLSIGAIAKVTDEFRIGASYESPTWYSLNDEQRQRIVSTCTDCGVQNPIIFDPNVVMVYDTYRLRTPSKVTGSAAYIFGKKGLLSVDVSQKDYSNITFRPSGDPIFNGLNNFNNTFLDRALEVRIGGEFRYKNISFRGGYRFEESPFKNGNSLGDLQVYSGGLGFNFRESRLDLAYSFARRDSNFALISSGMNDAARLNSINNNVTLTYIINF